MLPYPSGKINSNSYENHHEVNPFKDNPQLAHLYALLKSAEQHETQGIMNCSPESLELLMLEFNKNDVWHQITVLQTLSLLFIYTTSLTQANPEKICNKMFELLKQNNKAYFKGEVLETFSTLIKHTTLPTTFVIQELYPKLIELLNKNSLNRFEALKTLKALIQNVA